MVYEFKFPDVGEGITEGKLVKWLVGIGDKIKPDQAVAEVETDKAVVEIPSPKGGTVKELLFKEQDDMTVGKVMMRLDTDGAGDRSSHEDEEVDDTPVPKEPETQTSKISLPLKDKVKEGKDDSNRDVKAMPSVRKFARQKGINLETVNPTGSDGKITKEDVEIQTGHKVTSAVETRIQKGSKNLSKEILATPSTRKLARELHVDITRIKGTGDHGLITKEDIKAAAKKRDQVVDVPEPTSKVGFREFDARPGYGPSGKQGKTRVEKVSNIRKVIAKRMLESKHNAAHVTVGDEADVTELVAIRKKEKSMLKEKGIKLTFLPFFIKAAISSLKRFPYLNAEMTEKEVLIKEYYNIGFAADTEEGLMVPVVKDADHKSIIEIAKEVDDLAEKAKDRKLSPEDMKGGSFTITSVGSIGGQFFTPIINFPQVAILGIGRIMDKPVVKDGKIAIRKMVMLSLTFDHRVVDGAEAARFLKSLIEHLEDPDLMFMELM